MNRARFAGICRQLGGAINQTWGELSGDLIREAAGRRAQIIGKAQQVSVIEQEASVRQLKDFRHHNRNWNF
jgi:uncharacterized protein YjbJ (UPF0337 family)